MDVLNRLPPKAWEEMDSFLAFLSIYEDKARERAYLRLLSANAERIRGKVCVEAGCGLGVMSARMAALGAKKVYAVEVNRHLYESARERLAAFPNVEVVHDDVRDFDPPEEVDVLAHEFYGQLLYDEDLDVLSNLKFRPGLILPDGGRLLCGVARLKDMDEDVIDEKLLRRFDGVIVSGLFDEEGLRPRKEVLSWSASGDHSTGGLCAPESVDISGMEGELLYFGIELTHGGKMVCRSAVCDNWSFGWTWRKGDRFSLRFAPRRARGGPAPEALFRWLPP